MGSLILGNYQFKFLKALYNPMSLSLPLYSFSYYSSWLWKKGVTISDCELFIQYPKAPCSSMVYPFQLRCPFFFHLVLLAARLSGPLKGEPEQLMPQGRACECLTHLRPCRPCTNKNLRSLPVARPKCGSPRKLSICRDFANPRPKPVKHA